MTREYIGVAEWKLAEYKIPIFFPMSPEEGNKIGSDTSLPTIDDALTSFAHVEQQQISPLNGFFGLDCKL